MSLCYPISVLVKCTSCGAEKPPSDFATDRQKRNGLRSNCRVCSNAMTRRWRKQKLEENPDYYKEKYHANPEAAKARVKKYRDTNKERLNAEKKTRYRNDSEYRQNHLDAHKRYRDRNKERLRAERWLHGFWSFRRDKREKFGGFLRGQGFCIWCGELNPLKLQIAHIFPENHDDVISLCGSCHLVMDKYPAFLGFFD